MTNTFEFTQHEQEMIRVILEVIHNGYIDTYNTFIDRGDYEVAETYEHNIKDLKRIINELNKYK